uniref:Uncharacterized protein n=1 Tax=Arundo donax TaxID=35708 RepID=A0A0A9FB23_ARUDO
MCDFQNFPCKLEYQFTVIQLLEGLCNIRI